jgi:ribosomal protein S3
MITSNPKIYNTNLFEELYLLRLERYDYFINLFKKELIYFKFKQKLLFNQFKLNEVYISPLIKFLQKIYKKKVELNIIVLKNYYLNSSILLQIIETKLRKSKARGRHLKTVDRAMSRIRIPILSANKLQRLEKKNVDMQNVILDNFSAKSTKDNLDEFLLTKNSPSKKNIHKHVLKNLENKSIAGLFIKISGRLTKRYKAQRAVSTLRAKGTLKNVHSAHTGLPSTMSIGHSNINVDKTMLHSKNRIGAYGLTG